ncbi:MAG: response regulator, partial [Bacteriovoracaceae bacterium]|nr:response regulator [Bacteriovoracaceae bacterium]
MKKRHNEIRNKLIGLGEDSVRKSYYPELQRKYAEIEDSKAKLLDGFNEKRDFMRNILHELRTPIHGVNSLIHLLESTELDTKQLKIVENMVVSLSRLENLVGEIQDHANSGVFGTDSYRPVNINDLLENIVSPILSRNCVKFHSFDQGEKIEGQIVAKHLELSAALKNLSEYGSVYAQNFDIAFTVLKLGEDDNEVELKFDLSIDGLFADPAKINRFYSQIRSNCHLGSSHQKAENPVLAFGGIFQVFVGQKGTSYQYVAKFERYTPAVSSKSIVSVKCPKRILVVEDNEMNRNTMELLLEDCDCLVDMVENGKEGVEAFINSSYSLIFMDIKMPVMNGEEAITAIRRYESESESEAHTPIIAMTAYAMSGDRDRFLAIGADEYLSKPFDYDALEELINRYVS